MKTIILAGGKGLRISEETRTKPKPLIKIAGLTLLEHIMNIYKSYNFNEFIICGGYKFKILKKYFEDNKKYKNIKIINTGVNTETGERLLKIKKYLKNDENFFLTYGDGLSNINIQKLLKFHKKKKRMATMTVVKKRMNFGAVKLSSKKLVKNFEEKPNNQFINGGFFVFNKSIFSLLKKNKSLEFYTLPKLVKINNLAAYEHLQFWQCLDNYKDKKILEDYFKENYEKNKF